MLWPNLFRVIFLKTMARFNQTDLRKIIKQFRNRKRNFGSI